MKRVWNEEKNRLLRKLYPTGHLASLAARLGVTLKALKSRAKVMGVKRKVNVHHPWTDRQLNYLRKHYATMSAAEIAPKVKHTESSVYQKAKEGEVTIVPQVLSPLWQGAAIKQGLKC